MCTYKKSICIFIILIVIINNTNRSLICIHILRISDMIIALRDIEVRYCMLPNVYIGYYMKLGG